MLKVQGSRKRRLPSAAPAVFPSNHQDNTSHTPATTGILEGVVACLSGMNPEEKDRYHALIVDLGGVYTRDLNLLHNTHLISSEARGAKFETARASRQHDRLHIVRPSWLDECRRLGKRVDEGGHSFQPSKDDRFGHPPNESQTDETCRRSLDERLDQLVQQSNDQISDLFSGCHVYLVGFDDAERDRQLLSKLGKLIRRGLGTIYWDFQGDTITQVIVNVLADPSLREAAKALQGTGSPEFVSPWWVVHSCSSGVLANASDHTPIFRSIEAPRKKVIEKSKTASSQVLKGTVFCLLRVVPPSWAVDFDTQELETLIRNNGGQILSLKLVEALKVDQAPGKPELNANLASSATSSTRRTCYVIGWGGHSSSHLEIHPLLSQVKRYALCNVVETTPVWLLTCLSEQRLILPPSRNPNLFIPGKRPIHLLCDVARCCDDTKKPIGEQPKKRQLRISVTGFSGSTRSALIHAIRAMGVAYDDAMHTSTTHLICRQATGQKYTKAVEWGIKRVSIDWLYHVMQYGYHGEKGEPMGCEAQFQVR